MSFSDMKSTVKKVLTGGHRHKYTALPDDAAPVRARSSSLASCDSVPPPRTHRRSRTKYIMAAVLVVIFALLALLQLRGAHADDPTVCDTPDQGFQCSPEVSHLWGQYSPFFSVAADGDLDGSLPDGCAYTFVQLLSRHGARNPTEARTKSYGYLIRRIHNTVTSYGDGWEFIKDYQYTLGADDLTPFGQQQMVNSGIKFYTRYRDLIKSAKQDIFIRAGDQQRVVESAQNFTQGFHQSVVADNSGAPPYTIDLYPILAIPEAAGFNNTLSHGLCTAFESATEGNEAVVQFTKVFAQPIADKINTYLADLDLQASEVSMFMDMCPFNTVAAPPDAMALSPFCALFTTDEWADYDYLQSVSKWYGYGPGTPLGPTQGVGWVNELIARLTKSPVRDSTSTNRTLDASPQTFPLDKALYADFSHDRDMISMYSALQLYSETPMLNMTERTRPEDLKGFASSWTVPFAGRMYVEKMKCADQTEELVRVLVNDRVVPLQGCHADALGRCTLTDLVNSLTFASGGGLWDKCFEEV